MGPGGSRSGTTSARSTTARSIFIPAGVPHGFHNDGDRPLPLQAVFPTTRVWIRTLERNPAPGTEGDLPQAGATYDFRTGDVEFDAP